MWKRINWNGIRAYVEIFRYTINLSFLSSLVLIGLFVYGSSSIEIISISIGLIGIIAAVSSIESTTVQLKEVQADYWNAKGLDQLENRKYHDAFQAFDKANRLDPKSIKCLINKANALCEKGKRFSDEISLIDAVRVIENAIDLGPKYPAALKHGTREELKAIQEYANAFKSECDILLERANLLKESTYADELRVHAIKASRTALNKYPQQNPEIPGAYASKGNALCSLAQYDNAIDACTEAVRQAPHEALAWTIRANAFMAKGDYAAAIKDFDIAIGLKPDSSVFWYNKGHAIRKSENLVTTVNLAIHAYDKAIEFDKLQSSAWNQRGNAFAELGKYYQREGFISIRHYATDIDIYSNKGLFWLNNGHALFRQADLCFSEALRSYDMAIDINPNDGMFWSNRGKILKLIGRTDEANAAINKAMELGNV